MDQLQGPNGQIKTLLPKSSHEEKICDKSNYSRYSKFK